MKLKIFILFLLTSVIVKAQTSYQLNYDNVRIGKDGNSVSSFRGSLRFPYIGIGSSTDSVLTIVNGEVKKVPRSQFSSSSIAWGQITGALSNQADLNTKFNSYYLNTNPSGYISGITALMVTNALGFTPYSASNPNGFISTESDPIWSAAAPNYRTKSQNDGLYYPLTGNPSNFLTSFTETDPLVPAYAKSLSAFSVIKTSTDALYEPIFSKNTAFNKNFGAASGTVAEGNDSRINNGQTAFGWGNHATAGYLLSSTAATTYYPLTNPNGYTSNAGTVTNFSKTDGLGITSSVSNPTTTPNLTIRVDTTTIRTTTNSYTLSALQSKFNLYLTTSTASATFVPLTRTISTGNGLSGGSDLSSNLTLSADTSILATKANTRTLAQLQTTFNTKQATLVSGVNIKTVNGLSLLGAGDLPVIADTTVYRTVANSRSLAQTQTALNLKQNNITLTTTGSSGPATLIGATLNIPQYTGGGGSLPTLTAGSIPFSDGTTLSQDNSNLFWNNTTKRLGIGGNTPQTPLQVMHTPSSFVGAQLVGNSPSTNLLDDYPALAIINTNTTTNNYAGLDFYDNVSPASQWASASIKTIWTTHGTSNATSRADLALVTNGPDGFNTRLRITSGGLLNVPGLTASSMLKTDASKNIAVAVPGTDFVAPASLLNLTATNTTLTFSGSYNTTAARTVGLNLGNANTWTAQQSGTTPTAKDNTTKFATTGFTSKQFTATGSGTGAATTITVAHGITGVTSANSVIVFPNNAAAAGISYATMDATNVSIVYTVAPASGTNNLAYSISIK